MNDHFKNCQDAGCKSDDEGLSGPQQTATTPRAGTYTASAALAPSGNSYTLHTGLISGRFFRLNDFTIGPSDPALINAPLRNGVNVVSWLSRVSASTAQSPSSPSCANSPGRYLHRSPAVKSTKKPQRSPAQSQVGKRSTSHPRDILFGWQRTQPLPWGSRPKKYLISAC